MVYVYLFIIFFKVGILGFGGGYAILALIYQDVQSFGMMTPEEFGNLVGLSQVTPGPIAINAATYVGFKAAGLGGALLATFAVSLPSFVLCMAVLAALDKFNNNRHVVALLAGIRPATVGLMASAFIFMAQTAVIPAYDSACSLMANLEKTDLVALAIFIISFGVIMLRKFGAITITLGGGVAGLILCSIFSSNAY
ncbi:MAG: chromate transporter [Marinilabiliaceae bacterium]